LNLQNAKRIAISAFVLFHLLAITCWSIPLNSPLIAAFRDAVRPYFLWSGLFQGWDMFAPSPRNFNGYIEAVVIYKDGQTRTWTLPRMEHLSLTERYYKERYRKFSENLRDDTNSALWPDAARYIARLNNQVSDPPTIVLLARYWSEIPPPRSDGSYHAEPWHARIFYEYSVKPEDLK
jgi:hypothetical protein